MKRTKYFYLSLLFLPSLGFAQSAFSPDIDLQAQAFEFEVAAKVNSNLLTAPTRQNTISSGEESFEEYNNFALGVGAELIFSPVVHENFYYTYRHEWNMGLGIGTSYHYQLRGSEFAVGTNGLFLTFHQKTRFMNIVGYNPVAENSGTVNETVHYSKYSGIRHQAIGIRFNLGYESTLELAFLMERFKLDEGREPWQGALIRWDAKDSDWGIETMLFWNHAAYGYVFTSSEPTEELNPTGFFFTLKLNYRFNYRSNYGRMLDL